MRSIRPYQQTFLFLGACWVILIRGSVPSSSVFFISPSTMTLPSEALTWYPVNGSSSRPWALHLINETYMNLTKQLSIDISKKYSYCFSGQQDLERAFPKTQSSNFEQCAIVEEDPSSRLCTRAEVNIYFEALFSTNPISGPNCNENYWSRGCEPGWCLNPEVTSDNDNFNDPQYIPTRRVDPQPCCPGFFCPRALACMIPCPQGAYCPLSHFDTFYKNCDPYGYLLNPAIENNHCGGAHLWTDVEYSGMFCSPGHFCPNVTAMLPCEIGNYCRQGSTEQIKCLPFVRCGSKTERQNIQIYGYMLISLLSAMLILLYCCSDQMIAIQESHRYGARKRAQESLSRWQHIARRLSARVGSGEPYDYPEEMHVLVSYDSVYQQENTARELDHRTDCSTSENIKPRTRSQIFKYAYRQIEREGRHLPDQMFRPRLRIEIAFENLSMFLKRTGVKILCNVTGRLMPGDITAVMGPSGAGKTSFLSAIAGKPMQCRTTGHVVINGDHGFVGSYKKVIGFVPQDDIVHGILTVEENLYFSAKCRLPSNLPKYERVLVIERIMLALGLDTVRNVQVGTVESRGISGGQRKRVNVGLEMVMEPSVLILDEPTSGLDSTSSRLVLQALRREASVGVNVVAVLHQPNYNLFTMLDTVMLLAKGGRVAYLGPVNKVEEYFLNIGFPVPERVNPPDYFMDVLEGIVLREDGSVVSQEMLPTIWMQRLGYNISEDPSPSLIHSHGNTLEYLLYKSFWNDQKSLFSSVVDLSGRNTPGFHKQYAYVLERISRQRFREASLIAQDYIILLITGICVGLLSDVKDRNLGSTAYTFTLITVSLLSMVAALRTFSSDKLHFWREASWGINRVAYFLAKDTLDHSNTLLKPVVYLSMFYFFNDSRSTFLSNYIVTMGLIYCVTGIAYIFAITLEPSTSQLVAVFFPILNTLVATKKRTESSMDFAMDITYARYAFEAYIVSNAQRYDRVWLITRCGVLSKFGYRLDRFGSSVSVLIIYGLVARAIALFCLIFINKRKQQ